MTCTDAGVPEGCTCLWDWSLPAGDTCASCAALRLPPEPHVHVFPLHLAWTSLVIAGDTTWHLSRGLRGPIVGIHTCSSGVCPREAARLSLRGGGVRDAIYELENLCAVPELSDDHGINVTITSAGVGWRRPKSGDEVFLSYVATELGEGRQFERCDQRQLIRLGQDMLPAGLERAITLRFTKGAQGIVKLKPQHAFGAQGRPPLVGANVLVKYEITLWDWNDMWEAPDGAVLFRGLGQPALAEADATQQDSQTAFEEAAPAGDSDNLTLSITGVQVSASTSMSASCQQELDRVLRMPEETQTKVKSAAQSMAHQGPGARGAGIMFESLVPRKNVTVLIGSGLIEPPMLEIALQHLRLGQPARILVSDRHSFDTRSADEATAVGEGTVMVYHVVMLSDMAADEQSTEGRMEMAMVCNPKP